MSQLIENNKPEFEKVLEFTKKDLTTLRTGRANPILVENILVEAYGVKTPVKQLASINVPEARTIIIEPWDKNIVKDIEKAISASHIGVNPVNEGRLVRLSIPPLTTESRQELIKHVNRKVEQARIKIRNLRDKIKENIIESFKAKEISEDEKFFNIEKLDEMTKDYNNQIKELGEAKEKEIMTI